MIVPGHTKYSITALHHKFCSGTSPQGGSGRLSKGNLWCHRRKAASKASLSLPEVTSWSRIYHLMQLRLPGKELLSSC